VPNRWDGAWIISGQENHPGNPPPNQQNPTLTHPPSIIRTNHHFPKIERLDNFLKKR
jgi:hypothetical protein